MSVPNIKLNNGAEMPQVGFGLWKVDGAVAADVVYNAIKAGYRAFDGACDYGNEVECGRGIARAISEGIVKREDLFIISKLWNSFHDAERVEPIVKKQLGDWGIDYFDLYYIHFPVGIEYVDPSVRYPPGWWSGNEADKQIRPGKSTLQQTWHAIEELVPAGLAKSIGISNYTGALLLDLLIYAKTKPQALQIEHHPYYVSKDLTHLAKINDIAVVGYSSFGPQSFVDCDMQLAKDIPLLFDHEVIKKIAAAHGKTPAQVLLRWATQRGISVIPKSATESRLKQNLDVTAWDLTESEISEISALDLRLKFNSPPNYGLPCYVFA